MQVVLQPGKYVLAISGGVDSVVLLDLLADQSELELILAHFDHGIRLDSNMDRELVAILAQQHNLVFETAEGNLGPSVSEATAREARYNFLRQIREKYNAKAIVTAHHQDDAVETLALNVLRGTKRKGMSSLKSTEGIIRPLLPYTKSDIRRYAKNKDLQWREDSTNDDEKYTRNWIRRVLLPKLSRQQKSELVESVAVSKDRNDLVDIAVAQQLDDLSNGEGLDRRKFIALPYLVACEVMTGWLRQNGVKDYDRKLIDLLVASVKTLHPGKKISLGADTFLVIKPDSIQLA